MSIQRSMTWRMALGLLLALAAPAAAQSEPEFVPNVPDFEFFDQPDLSDYGVGRQFNSGWFASAEYLSWAISSPERAVIGNPDIPVLNVAGNAIDTFNTGTYNSTLAPSAANLPLPSIGVTEGILGIGTVEQFSSASTGYINAQLNSGSRYELGYTEDGFGWFLSGFVRHGEEQALTATDASINFDNAPIAFIPVVTGTPLQVFDRDVDGDGVFGRFGRDRGTRQGNVFVNPRDGIPDPEDANVLALPTDFDDAVPVPTVYDELRVKYRTEVWGLEANGSVGLGVGPLGGRWVVFGGPRYLNYNDEFNATAFFDNPPLLSSNPARFLNETIWNTDSQNHIVGPQMGFRATWGQRRLMLMVEGRLFPGANFQTVRQTGQTASQGVSTAAAISNPQQLVSPSYPFNVVNWTPQSFNNSYHSVEFAPTGELRVDARYQLFRLVSLRAGWTGMYTDGLARSPDMVVYRMPDFGIRADANRQDVFVNGINFGVEINR